MQRSGTAERSLTARIAAACAALVAAAACGPPEAWDAGTRRVSFAPVGSVDDWRRVRAVPAGGPESWELLAGEGGAQPGGFVFAGAGERRLSIAGPFDLGAVDRVDLVAEASGATRLQAAFVRDERPVLLFDAPSLAGGAEERVELALPDDARGTADALWIGFQGRADHLRLASVEVLDCPQPSYVPAPDEGPRPVTLGEDTRQAVGLFPGRELVARVELGGGERLAFEAGFPGRGAPGARVWVRVEQDASAWTHPVPEPRPERPWTAARIDLSDLDPGPATLRFGLEPPAGEPVAAALTVPVLYRPRRDPPTVLLVTSDTHRGDYLGAARSGVDVETPVLDALASRGLFFEDCASTTNITTPSHVTLFTAVHPRDHGVLDNETALAVGAPTLAEAFQAAGWATLAAASASHLGPERSGLGQGFDRYAAPAVNQRLAFDAAVQIDRWIDEVDDRPAFVWLHLFDAHAPYAPPPPWHERYWTEEHDPRDERLPPPPRVPWWAHGVRDLRYLECLYRGAISHLDERIERLFEHPRLAGGWIAFTADHGEYLGVEDGWFNHLTLDVANLRVPLILVGPGVPVGRVSTPVVHADLGRTLLDLAGLAGAEFPGENLLNAVDGGAADPRFAIGRYGEAASVESDGWMLVRHLADHSDRPEPMRFTLGQEQLFHVRADPACRNDLVAEEPDRARRLAALLDEFLAGARPLGWASGERITTDAERRELEALGYGGGGDEQGER